MMSNNQSNLRDTVHAVLTALGSRQVKGAQARTEPGGWGTTSKHPSTQTDDGTRAATQGTRGDEIDRDLHAQEDIGNHSPPAAKSQDALQPNMGVEQSNPQDNPGESQRETRETPEDGGTYYGKTQHPARVDNEEVQKKYAGASKEVCELLTLVGETEKLAAEYIPALAAEARNRLEGAPSTPATPAAPAAPQTKAAEAPQLTEADQAAAEKAVVFSLAGVLLDAMTDATKTASWMKKKLEETRQNPQQPRASLKRAGAEPPPEASGDDDDDDDDADDMASGGGDASAGPGDSKPSDDELLLAASGGQGGAPKDPLAGIMADVGNPSGENAPPAQGGGMPPMPGGGGGMPPEAAGLMDPGAGGMPPDAGGGMDPMAGGGSGMSPEEEQALLEEMIAQEAMAQEGVSPEQLKQGLAGSIHRLVEGACKKASHSKKASTWKPKTAAEKKRLSEWRSLIRELAPRQ